LAPKEIVSSQKYKTILKTLCEIQSLFIPLSQSETQKVYGRTAALEGSSAVAE